MRASRLPKVLGILVVLCGMALLVYGVYIVWQPRAHELFRRYIMDPVPTSVAQIRVDQPMAGRGYGYVFRFAINRTDLELIRESRLFRPARITSFMGGGSLYWDWEDIPSSGEIAEKGRAFSVYGREGAPSWYDLESWDNQETHILVKKDKHGNTSDIEVLLYNAELGSAFFIVFHYGGTVPFF